MSRRLLAAGLLAAAAIGSPRSRPAEPQANVPPSDIVETTGRSLAQIDVTVSGDPAVIKSLGPEDFALRIQTTPIRDFTLDRLCGDVTGSPAQVAGAPAAARPSFLLYFDQQHLSLGGRQGALDVGRQLVRQLVRAGARAMIVSNARELTVVEPFTADAERLLAALERLEHDRKQWDTYVNEEENRVAHVVHLLNNESDVYRATSVARGYQREELWRTQRNLQRLAMTLTRLADVEAPKAVLYFADAMRSNPGEHYLVFFGDAVQNRYMALTNIASDAFAAEAYLDRVINEAVAHGVRFYAVQAAGLTNVFDRVLPNLEVTRRTQASPMSAHSRQLDVQNTLSSLGAETGGASFFNGVAASRIGERIAADMSCLYLLSFDPSGFAVDEPLRVVVKPRRAGVQFQSRGRIVLQSASSRTASRLLSAFALAQASTSGAAGVRTQLVATGYRDEAFEALLQVRVPGTSLSDTTWDLGASLYTEDEVRGEAAGRVSVLARGVPVILEHELRLAPGSYEVVSVAHETRSDFTLSDRSSLRWPAPDAKTASIGPIGLLQPARGVFVREGEARTSGSIAHSEDEALTEELPTAIVALVCGGHAAAAALRVERRLIGESEIELPPIEVEPNPGACAQVRDLVPAGTLGAGWYRFVVSVTDRGRVVAESSREFAVVSDPEVKE